MCGIAGILKVHPPGTTPPPPKIAIPESWLDGLDESIKHRGPDGQGRFRDRATRPDGAVVDVAFVHRRLAIIDLADGQQPMISERGPGYPERVRSLLVAVVFNGCIYNHRKLRQELQAAGHEFVTDHSDTEVLIHGWREWGHGLFAKLDGMFAIAVWDRASAQLAYASDRFGEKPLYTTHHATQDFVFASSPIAIVQTRTAQSRGTIPRVNTRGMVGWLRFGWNPMIPLEGFSLTRTGTPQVEPVAADECRPHGQSNAVAFAEVRTDSMTVGEVDSLIRKSVAHRLEADVPLGVFLSGGIDSALILSYASELRPDIEAFTVRMPDHAMDESQAASVTARALGVRHHVLECQPNPAEDLQRLIRQLGLPFGDSSLLPATWVSAAARQAVRVALGGDGGDEFFLGYERHRMMRALFLARMLPVSLNRFVSNAVGGPAAGSAAARRAARFFDAAAGAGYADLLSIFPQSLLRRVVADETRYRAREHDVFGSFKYGRGWDAFEANALWADGMYLSQDLLRKTDTASMTVALEVRAPFLAKELVDRMIRVRTDVLMPDGERKGLLKAVARKYLPDEIVNRPKMGFSIPVGEWFRNDYGGMKQLLLDTLNSADPYPENLLGIKINRAFVATMIDDHMDRKRDHSQRLYMLLVLAIWADWLRSASRDAG